MNDIIFAGLRVIMLDIQKLYHWSIYALRVALIIVTLGRYNPTFTKDGRLIKELWGKMTNDEKARLLRLSRSGQHALYLSEIERMKTKYDIVVE